MFSLRKKTPPTEQVETLTSAIDPPKKTGIFGALGRGLKRTRAQFTENLASLFLGDKIVDAALLEEMETHLLVADVGVAATEKIIEEMTAKVKRRELANSQALLKALQHSLFEILKPCEASWVIPTDIRPYVILMVGVNGAGKTTTIGKLAKWLNKQGLSTMLAAGDTFRAAAIEQLQVWGQRNNIPVIAQHSGADSASVIFDGVAAAKARNVDVLIADTAGRLHTQAHLMEELKKIKRVLGKIDAQAPHETMLVLDSGVGQNGLRQAQQFNEAIGLSSLVITKLDGTAKGGVIFSMAESLKLPIRFLGVGEGLEDLQPFNAHAFVQALFTSETEKNV